MTKSPVMIDRRALLCTTVLGWLMAGPARAASGDFVAAAGPLAPGATPSDTRAEALHLLNRLAYGPTADEFERVMRIGAERGFRLRSFPFARGSPGVRSFIRSPSPGVRSFIRSPAQRYTSRRLPICRTSTRITPSSMLQMTR